MSHSALDALFELAESPMLFVRTSVANNVASLAYLFLQFGEVHRAIQTIAADPRMAEAVLRRLGLLLTQQLPANERHPYDVAVAVYLFVLGRSNALALDEALREVRDSGLPNLDWAYAMHNWLVGTAPATVDQYEGAGSVQSGRLDAAPAPPAAGLGARSLTSESSDRWECAG